MMNALASSECNSGCESGWTLYLQEHSFLNNHNASSHRAGSTYQFVSEDDGFYEEQEMKDDKNAAAGGGEEEDLSMVSDASSGPPHFPDIINNESNNYFNAQLDKEGCCFYSASKAPKVAEKRSKKRQKLVNQNQPLLQDQHLLPSHFLDDTASSPIFDFSMNNVTITNQQTSTESVLDYHSQGFSATYFEGRTSLLQDHIDFLQPSLI